MKPGSLLKSKQQFALSNLYDFIEKDDIVLFVSYNSSKVVPGLFVYTFLYKGMLVIRFSARPIEEISEWFDIVS